MEERENGETGRGVDGLDACGLARHAQDCPGRRPFAADGGCATVNPVCAAQLPATPALHALTRHAWGVHPTPHSHHRHATPFLRPFATGNETAKHSQPGAPRATCSARDAARVVRPDGEKCENHAVPITGGRRGRGPTASGTAGRWVHTIGLTASNIRARYLSRLYWKKRVPCGRGGRSGTLTVCRRQSQISESSYG